MTGHIKVWEIVELVAPPPSPPPPRRSTNLRSRKEAGARGGRGGKHRGFDEALSALRSPPEAERCSDPAALWGKALPMARATSLSFSPDDSATFALACWDGRIALFLPTTAAEAAAAAPASSLSVTWANTAAIGRQNGRNGTSEDLGSRRAWKHVWRPAACPPGKIGGGKGVTSLEDQDGAFLCWCAGPQGPDASAAHLAVSSYYVMTGNCPRRRCGEEDESDGRQSSTGGALPPHVTSGESLSPKPPQEGLSLTAATGPGVEVFEAGGLGERIGGALSGPRPPGLTPEPTAERHLIHGLAAGPGFVALYDSDHCLHAVSLAAIISAGCVLPPPEPLSACRLGAEDLSMPDGAAATSPDAADTAEAAEASTPPSSATNVTLVNNDHGLIKACIRRHSGPDGVGVDGAAPPDEGLELAITWRNALSGVETPDDGKCVGEETSANDRRLSFLPGKLADRDLDDDSWDYGVFCADVRWGSFALFTRYTVLVYTQPDRKEAAGEGRAASGGSAPVAGPAGGWRAYAEHPIVDGLLLGAGASTSSPLSQNLPEPPADLKGLYLLTLLGATDGSPGGSGPFVSIQSLGDESVACRCLLVSPGDDEGNEGGVARKGKEGERIYASPGYGGGAFVAAAKGEDGECARVWRGSFDEGACRLLLGQSKVITSYPWPEPETLLLQGVAGPNCELFLFKELEGGSDSAEAADADTSNSVRWWITWPGEMDLP
ncbi:unnamed protein product [Hapterophycus canaliculatus]